ncbi:MAG: hypothetical protein ACQEVA_14245 [Myxococcota bacterium]
MLSPKALLPFAAMLFLTTLTAVGLTTSSAHAQEPPPPPSTSDTDGETDSDASDAPPPPPPVDDLGDADTRTSQDVESTGGESNGEAQEYWDTQPRQPQPGKRIALEGLGGLGGMAGGYLVGGFSGALAGALINQDPYSALIGAVIGLSVGGLMGTPLGIWAAGNAVDGNGSYWTTLGGTTLGFVAAGIVSTALQTSAPGVGGVGGVVLPITGGIIAYELSNDGKRQNAGLQTPGLRLSAGIAQPQRGNGAVMLFGASW